MEAVPALPARNISLIAMILAFASLACGPVVAVAAIHLGNVGEDTEPRGKAFAITAQAVGSVSLLVTGFLWTVFLGLFMFGVGGILARQ